jgi:hypothetical protein
MAYVINSPSDVPTEHDSQSESPNNSWPTSKCKIDKWLSKGDFEIVLFSELVEVIPL